MRVELKKIQMFGKNSTVTSNAVLTRQPEVNADQHLAIMMQKHLDSDLQGGEENDQEYKQLHYLKQLLKSFEEENYELLRTVNDSGAVLHLLDSSLGGQFRPFSEELKNVLVNFAISLGKYKMWLSQCFYSRAQHNVTFPYIKVHNN